MSSASCVTCSDVSESWVEASKRFSERVRTDWPLVPPFIVSPSADLPSFRANLVDCSSMGFWSFTCAPMPSRYMSSSLATSASDATTFVLHSCSAPPPSLSCSASKTVRNLTEGSGPLTSFSAAPEIQKLLVFGLPFSRRFFQVPKYIIKIRQ